MPTSSSRAYKIALLGFSEFERTALGVCFRLGGGPGPAYALTQKPAEADFLLVDCDHRPSVEWVQVTDRTSMAVFIGADPPDEALSWMSRPIDPLHVMRELEAMAALAPPAAAPPLAPVPTPAPTPALTFAPPFEPRFEPTFLAETPARLDPVVDQARAKPDEPVLRDTWQPETQPGWEPEWPPGWRPLEPSEARTEPQSVPPAPPPPPAPLRGTPRAPPAAPRKAKARAAARARITVPQTALVVDDSEVAARFLQRKLEGWGLQVECASASRQALAMLDHRSYDLVFVDVELGPNSELDGLALCQRIKQSTATVGADLIVVSAHQGELDRARGALAGCDAYLGKPLRDVELAPLLLRRGLVQTQKASEPI